MSVYRFKPSHECEVCCREIKLGNLMYQDDDLRNYCSLKCLFFALDVEEKIATRSEFEGGY